MIQAVVFDFGNVIYRFDSLIFVEKVAPASTLAPDEIRTQLRQSSDLFQQYETGTISSEEFFLRLTSRLHLNITREDFIVAFCAIFTPVESTLQLIRQLKGRYRLGLLSNTSEWHFEHVIARAPVFSLFDIVTLSFVVHAMKPDEAIYRDVLQKLNLPPESCIYIDDLKENADAASALGMKGIHFASPETLVEELGKLGITHNS